MGNAILQELPGGLNKARVFIQLPSVNLGFNNNAFRLKFLLRRLDSCRQNLAAQPAPAFDGDYSANGDILKPRALLQHTQIGLNTVFIA